MARVEVSPTFIEFDGVARAELGPALKSAVASAETLDNAITAEHYQVGRHDAVGVAIELGKPFSYLDWLGDRVWYVYHFEAMPDELADARGFVRGTEYWAEKGVKSTQAEAEAFAQSLV